MNEIVKMLDKNLDYISHEFINDVYYIKVSGYMRVSVKDKQNSTRQLKALKDYATKNKFKIHEVFEDKISGTIKAKNRKQYLKLKNKLRNRDALILTDLDRLGRNADDVITELKELKQIGIRVIALICRI